MGLDNQRMTRPAPYTEPLLRTDDVLAYFGGNHALAAKYARVSRQATYLWREYVPELPMFRLLDAFPELRLLLRNDTGESPLDALNKRLDAAKAEPAQP